MSVNFTHLHVHTPKSLIDGYCRIEPMLELAKEYGMKHVAVSEHGNCSSHHEFYIKAKAAGIKPILACEVYIAPDRHMRGPDFKMDEDFWNEHPSLNHLLLIARTKEGHENLLKMTSIAHMEGMYKKPRVDFELIQKYGKGIICTTACLGSPTSQYILRGQDEMAKGMILYYEQCFDEVYLELQPSTMSEQLYVNQKLIEFSEELNIPLVATTDAHMLRPEDKQIHEQITMINKKKKDDSADIDVYEHCYFMSADEVLSFGIPEIALTNAYEIGEKCNVELELDGDHLPRFDAPGGKDLDSYLNELTQNALLYYWMDNPDIDFKKYQDRVNFELDILFKKKLSGYMLIVWDYINFARKNGIAVGPGRGKRLPPYGVIHMLK